MRLQYLTVVFIIIFLPIIIVTTYYVHNNMETIRTQLKYDADLLDATHDAMAAFEINTANEDLSTVSDSLRSIIEASNNILLNTLAINFGVSNASKAYVQPYIPAVLYSLYDGYYIYSPTNTPIVCTDKYGQTISTDSFGVTYSGTKTYTTESGATKKIGIYKFDKNSIVYPADSVAASGGPKVTYTSLPNDIKSEYGQMLYENEDGTYSAVIHSQTGSSYNTKYKISYILKSYVPYAVTYKDTAKKINITVNYTLDNYITILGDIGGIYYSKSGYFINKNLIEKITVNGNTINWYTYSDEELENMSKNPSSYEVKIYFNADKNGNKVTISNKDNGSWEDAQNAASYYARAWAFSQWIYNTNGLKNLTESNTVTTVHDLVNENIQVEYKDVGNVTENLLYDFSASNNKIFCDNPEDTESSFNEHKKHAIRNSITYNLCLAMTAYNDKYEGFSFDMPVLSDVEWDKILSNVSILTFMQGLNCGMKMYNNYALVCSNNNEISVTPGEIYYTNYTTSITDGDKDYTEDGIVDGVIETVHRINCPKLKYSEGNAFYTSIKSKEIKYDKNYNSILEKYDYDHKVYTCYDCLANPNYIGISGRRNGAETLVDSIVNANDIGVPYINKLKAYYIALGKERENLYKPTDIGENSAIEIFNYTNSSEGHVTGDEVLNLPGGKKSTYNINRIAKIEVTITDTSVNASTKNLYTTTLTISLNSKNALKYNQVIIPVTSTTTRTIELAGTFSEANKLEKIKFDLGSNQVNFYVKSIKIYYK